MSLLTFLSLSHAQLSHSWIPGSWELSETADGYYLLHFTGNFP